MITCYLHSVGLAAPGLESWSTGRTLLLSDDPLHNDPETPYAPNLLPPNERRRATAAIRQAFRAAEDALRDHASDPSRLASVFASSDADLAVLNRICNALTQPERQISPTDFHNSVHNAASGYFSIAIRSMSTTTTVAAFDASFAAGLLEAATLANIEGCDVLFVAYDVIGPPPLLAVRPMTASGSCALLLTATRGPATLGGTPVTIHLIVDDADAWVARAAAAGATVKMPVEDPAVVWEEFREEQAPVGHLAAMKSMQPAEVL